MAMSAAAAAPFAPRRAVTRDSLEYLRDLFAANTFWQLRTGARRGDARQADEARARYGCLS